MTEPGASTQARALAGTHNVRRRKTKAAKALPCPFCGDQPNVDPYRDRVSCATAKCLVNPAVSHDTIARAIEAWNMRAST